MKKLSVFTRIGGKFSVREKLADMLPDSFDVYVEPFAGGAQTFLEMKLRYRTKGKFVLSDINHDIYSIWAALSLPELNIEKIKRFPWEGHKERFYKIKQWKPRSPENLLCRALYLFLYSYSGTGKSYAHKPYNRGKGFIENLSTIRRLMKGVTVVNEDYMKIVRKYDSPSTVFYLDPPYSNKSHLYENRDVDMIQMERVLRQMKGKFVLSIDDCKSHRQLFKNYSITSIVLPYSSGTLNYKRRELVVTNF